MKKILSFMLIILLFGSIPAFGVPVLQLDIGGGYYHVSGDPRYDVETVIAPGDVFTLYALMQESKKTSLDDTYYISMALFPRIEKTIPALSLGSITFGGKTINVTEDMDYGNPGISAHGIFPTYYYLLKFEFTPSENGDPERTVGTVGIYNTQDNPGQFDFFPGTGLHYAAFKFDTTKLSDDYSIHFDLYNENTKAPFSHDASDAQSDPPAIPEPATMLLLGSGLVGLAGFRRRFRKG